MIQIKPASLNRVMRNHALSGRAQVDTLQQAQCSTIPGARLAATAGLSVSHAYIVENGLQVAGPAFENYRVNVIAGNLGIQFRMCGDQYGLLTFCEDRYLGWQVGDQLGSLKFWLMMDCFRFSIVSSSV